MERACPMTLFRPCFRHSYPVARLHVRQSYRHVGTGFGLNRSMRRRMSANRSRGIATSVSWNVKEQTCGKRLTPPASRTSGYGYEPPWTGIIEAHSSSHDLHALISPPELLHMTHSANPDRGPARGWHFAGFDHRGDRRPVVRPPVGRTGDPR